MKKTFSKYVQKLYKEITVTDLCDKIDLTTRLVKASIKDGVKYDFDPSDSTLESIYKGTRSISKNIACTICQHFDQDKLYKFIFDGIKEHNTILLQDNPELEDTYRTMANEHVDEYIRIIYSISKFDTRYVNVFLNEFKKYHIQEIIENCDPSYRISSNQIEQCDQFVKCVQKYYSREIVTSAPEELTVKYLEFAEELDSYIYYLGINMVLDTEVKNFIFDSKGQILRFDSALLKKENKSDDDQWFVPMFRDENPKWAYNFKKCTDEYRTNLCDLYTEITKIIYYM